MADHDHNEHAHSHVYSNEKAVGIAALLTGSFMLAEVFGGIVSGSLALLADAGHMLTDFGSLLLAFFAFRLARRPADWKRTYGFDRFSILAAFINGLSLFVIAAWICIEAFQRFKSPNDIMGGLMLWVALGGLIINILAFWILSRNEGDNLNVRAAALHVAGDLLGSVAALIASLIIIYSGWTPIDPILSVLVALIIFRSAWHVVRESGHILLEGAPTGFDHRKVELAVKKNIPGVERVHHIHAWSITPERPMLTLEVDVVTADSGMRLKKLIKELINRDFGIEHVTVEISESATTPKR